MGVSAGVREERDDASCAARPKVLGFMPSLCARAGSGGGERIRGEVGVGTGNGEEEANELRLFHQAALEVAANAKAGPPNLALLYRTPSSPTAADGAEMATGVYRSAIAIPYLFP
jgi:hypothetical protein